MPTLTPLRRGSAAALLAQAALFHHAAFALDVPGAAPPAPAPLPDYTPQRIGALFRTNPDRPMAMSAVRMDRLDAYLAAWRSAPG